MNGATNSGSTHRPPAYAQMLVDSTDRYPSGYPANQDLVTPASNWQLNNQNSALYGYFTRLAVTQAQLFYNTPTIVASVSNNAPDQANDTFYITQTFTAGPIAGFPTLPYIPVKIETGAGGWYDYEELAAAIQTALRALPGVQGLFTVTYDLNGGGFLFENSTTQFAFVSPSALVAASLATSAQEVSVVRCLTTLGLINNTGVASTGGGPYFILGGPPTMLFTQYIDIVSRYLTKYQRAKDFTTLKNPTKSSILMRIYMTAPNTASKITQFLTSDGSGAVSITPQSPFSQPYTICIDPNVPKYINWSPDEAIANFDLQLLDDLGIELPFSESTLQYGAQTEYQLTIFATEN